MSGDALHRIGLGLERRGPHVWIHGASASAFGRVLPALDALRAAVPRCRHLLTTSGRDGLATLRAWCPDADVLPPPFDAGPTARRFVARLDPRVLVRLDHDTALGPRLLDALARRGVPIVDASPGPDAADLTRRLVSDVVAGLRAAPPPIDAAREPPRLLPGRAQAVADLDELSDRLGRPRTLLCLGNGPSVLAPELAGMSFDALFRVNWRWAADRRFAQPHMVFTGDASRLSHVPGCILGVRTPEEEARMLGQRAWRPRPWHITYAPLACLPLVLNECSWDARPTNGAAMIATAAALQPRRLIIAGVDLFAHPGGAYPGDTRTPNAYLPVHDREVEVAIAARALAGFTGEVVILSPALRDRLATTGPVS